MDPFSTVRINQLSEAATKWLSEALAALDAKDVDKYTSFMADDVEVIFNNGETTMRGREAVRAGLAQDWKGFGSLRHEELNVYGTDSHFVHEALNHMTTIGGEAVTLRAAAFVDRDEDGKIKSLRLFSDQGPLWARS